MVAGHRPIHRSLLSAGAALAVLAGAPVSAAADTLREALVTAYGSNPTIRAERANLRATNEGVNTALAGWRPTVTVAADAGRQVTTLETPVLTSDQKTEPAGVSVIMRQPVLTGVASPQIESAEAMVRAGRARLRAVEQGVLLDVVSVYTAVLQNRSVVDLNIKNEARLQRQLDATRSRFEVGEVTRTDVSSSEAALARARAESAQAEGNLVASRAAYARTVGRAPGKLAPPPSPPGLPGSKADALGVADKANPNLRAAMLVADAAAADIRAARGRLLPRLDLEASASRILNTPNDEYKNTTVRLRGVLTAPIYQGGGAFANVSRQMNLRERRNIQVIETRRLVREGVSRAWESLVTARARIKAGRAEVSANKLALDGVSQEAEVGLRTTLNVLDAQQLLLTSQVGLVRAERDAYVGVFALLDAIGRLDVNRLALGIEPFDPEAHYRRARGRWFGTTVRPE